MIKSKVLIGRNNIENYLDIKKQAFYNFVKFGMPAQKINGSWVAHKDIIDNYFLGLFERRREDEGQ